MKKKANILLVILIIIILSGCAVRELKEKRYYIFDYIARGERSELFMDSPLPFTVLVQDARISQTYTRKQIVKRHYGPQIRYMDYDLWGIRLQDAIADLAAVRINKYHFFASTSRDMMVDIPDYQINTTVNNLEIYETAFLSEAHLNIEFSLVKVNENNPDLPDLNLVYSVDRTERIEQGDVEIFVQQINELILQETDNFLVNIYNKYLGRDAITIAEERPELRYEQIDYSAEIMGDSMYTDNRDIGLVYLPNLSNEDNEPYYYAFDKTGRLKGSARMGEELPLAAGTYDLEYGTIAETQPITQKVEIQPRLRYNVKPNWGCLIVDVMDEQRNYAKVSYTIFDNVNGYDYGIAYPADENLGEKPTIWVLKPGTYKITINSESYNTYRDFTTIEVLENTCQRLSLIVEEEEESSGIYTLIGAGVLHEADTQQLDSNWNLGSAIHVNVNLNTDNAESEDETELSINMSAQLDNSAYYNLGRLHYTLKNLIEVGTNKDEDYDQFRVDLDDFDLKNTVIYNFISVFGIYGRFDMSTHFFPGNAYDLSYVKVSTAGDTISAGESVNSVRTSPSFFPMTLKEGFGLNFQVINNAKADMNLRAGLGSRQDIRNDVYTYTSDWTDSATGTVHKVYTEEESSYYEGVEASLVGDMQIMRNISYSLTADFLFPFDKEKSYTMDLENIFNIKLFKYVSIDYRLKFTRDTETQKNYISNQQSLFLRFTYLLR